MAVVFPGTFWDSRGTGWSNAPRPMPPGFPPESRNVRACRDAASIYNGRQPPACQEECINRLTQSLAVIIVSSLALGGCGHRVARTSIAPTR